MIIEFAGPSCSGKSTLIRGLEGVMRSSGLAPRNVSTFGTSLQDKLRGAGSWRLLVWCLLNPRLGSSEAGRRLLGAVGATRRLRREDGLVLLDEGPVKQHKNKSLRRARGNSFLVRGIPAPDVLVVVTCDPQVRLARLRKQDRPHARAISDEEILGRVTGDVFAHRFGQERNVPVVEVDTSDGGDNAAALLERLRPFYTPAA